MESDTGGRHRGYCVLRTSIVVEDGVSPQETVGSGSETLSDHSRRSGRTGLVSSSQPPVSPEETVRHPSGPKPESSTPTSPPDGIRNGPAVVGPLRTPHRSSLERSGVSGADGQPLSSTYLSHEFDTRTRTDALSRK